MFSDPSRIANAINNPRFDSHDRVVLAAGPHKAHPSLFIEPGQRLRRERQRLYLTYREVEEASQRIAIKHSSDEFGVGLSRLADIENKGTVPSIYRLYSLCAIYGLDIKSVLLWYGVDLGELAVDAAQTPHGRTHLLKAGLATDAPIELPPVPPTLDLRNTSYLGRQIQKWGKLPMSLLKTLELEKHCYAFIGRNDWSMYPILAPGAFIQIDERKRKIVDEWRAHETERPIYFIEHRTGYRCGWCTERGGMLILQSPRPRETAPEVFRYPGAVDVLGQVVGAAMRLDIPKRQHL
jgi:transcriptional regulator with XRE-family HTH domain